MNNNNKKGQKEIEIRNIYFVSYLQSKGYNPTQIKTLGTLHIWCFPYKEEIFELQREFYLDTKLQAFISAFKDVKRNTYNKEGNNGKGNSL